MSPFAAGRRSRRHGVSNSLQRAPIDGSVGQYKRVSQIDVFVCSEGAELPWVISRVADGFREAGVGIQHALPRGFEYLSSTSTSVADEVCNDRQRSCCEVSAGTSRERQ
jgi:hypothetical protein